MRDADADDGREASRCVSRNAPGTPTVIAGQSFLDVPESGAALDNLYLDTDLGTLDLLSRITGVGDYERVARDAIVFELFGRRVRAISLHDLIVAKEALDRDKDLIAAKELRAIREKLLSGSAS